MLAAAVSAKWPASCLTDLVCKEESLPWEQRQAAWLLPEWLIMRQIMRLRPWPAATLSALPQVPSFALHFVAIATLCRSCLASERDCLNNPLIHTGLRGSHAASKCPLTFGSISHLGTGPVLYTCSEYSNTILAAACMLSLCCPHFRRVLQVTRLLYGILSSAGFACQSDGS